MLSICSGKTGVFINIPQGRAMVQQSGSGRPDPRFVLRRNELPPSRRERLMRIGLRVVTVVLLAAALTDLVFRLVRHG
ncbi:hypothetical protein SXCC_00892 [Gluconacetobacter sp. SXCC-1]|nr:hypothetical protein SXCC_00892 [Gluconacetobacter sp. SXCC-1]